MKAIVGLYIKMLRHLGYTNIRQCKARITKADLRYFRIAPEQHRVAYLYQALEHISKTPSKQEFSVSERLIDKFRRRELARINQRILDCPSDSPEQITLRRTRDLIESQTTPPPTGMA